MTLTKDTPCQGGCGKVRSILCSDSPADWLCNDCRTKSQPAKLGRSKAAKARKLNVSLNYRVDIIGFTWEGFEGTYSYSFDHEPTSKEIRSKAGDFQEIKDYCITAVRRTQFPDGYRIQHTVVEPWKRDESDLQFMASQEGN
jgi:hypothetical protein